VPANLYAKHKLFHLTEHPDKTHPCAAEYEILGSTVAQRCVGGPVTLIKHVRLLSTSAAAALLSPGIALSSQMSS
jgi:hypothetical protein